LEAPAGSRTIGDLTVVIGGALEEGLMWGVEGREMREI